MSKACSVCRKDAGDIVCCYACQAPYHPACVKGCLCCKKKPVNPLGRIPELPDDWLCKLCEGHVPPLQDGEKVLSLVYAFGCNQAGQLGIGKLETKENAPVLVEDLKSVEVAEMAVGGWNSMLRTADGEVYSCGDGEHGKTGHSDVTHEHLCKFRRIEKLKRENCSQVEGHISRVALGRDHACAITSDGHIYTWGNGDDGKLGHQDMGAKKEPKKISALRELEQPISDIVSLGHTFTMCIAIDNILMTWGGNSCGQLATGDARGKWVPQMINPDRPELVGLSYFTKNTESTYDITEPIKELYAGKTHGVALTKTGSVWTWGGSVTGQTGMGEEKTDPEDLWARNYKNLVRPKLVPALSAISITQMAVGADHCLALSSEGELWGWGANNFGQLGLGASGKSTIWTPIKIDTEEILGHISQLSAGDGHSGCVTNIGDIYTWGDGREGQLGHGSFDSVSKPTLLKFTRDPEAAGQTPVLYCGGFHTFISIRTRNRNASTKKAAPVEEKKTDKKSTAKKDNKKPPKGKAEKAAPAKKASTKAANKRKKEVVDDSGTETDDDSDSDAPITKKKAAPKKAAAKRAGKGKK